MALPAKPDPAHPGAAAEVSDHDAELLTLTNYQLRTFERLHLFASHYVSRIVDHISFPTPGQQLCQREIHLRLPKLDGFSDDQQAGPYIVSLGQYRRRRLADFTVTDGRGTRLNLLSRRQHGYVIALALLRPHLTVDEWSRLERDATLHPSLNELRIYLASLITSIVPNEHYTTEEAGKRLQDLLDVLEVDEARSIVEVESFRLRCDEAQLTTRYLCWVDGAPGGMIQLHATYTQPESPQPTHEPDRIRPTDTMGMRSIERRLRGMWRNGRNRFYTGARMMPVRYAFATPAFVTTRSYYFLLTPPLGTEIVLLDWDADHRYAPDQTGGHLTSTTEVEAACWAYHFHNHRVAPRRRRRERRRFQHGAPVARRGGPADRRAAERRRDSISALANVERRLSDRRLQGADRRQHQRRKPERRQADQRQPDAQAGALIHAFVRSEQVENGKLIAIGLLSFGLAILAAQGVLQTVASETTNQILLLAPAALVLTVDQQSRHHFAALTPMFRAILWSYIVLALVFATSIVVSVHRFPFTSANITVLLPRLASGAFAAASGLLVLAFWWAGPHFAVSNKKRYKRVVKRLRIFRTRSRTLAWLRYQCKPKYWLKRQRPARIELTRRPDETPSHEVYANLARHSADRITFLAIAATALAIYLMVSQHWAAGEACAIQQVHTEQVALSEQRPFSPGTCHDGSYSPNHFRSRREGSARG